MVRFHRVMPASHHHHHNQPGHALFETVNHGNVLIHGWKYGLMSSDVSMGFKAESGTAPEYLASPTPGATNESSAYFSAVCINEFQATSDFGGPDDWVEIYNRGDAAFDLSGCFLSDQRGNNTKWTFPEGTILDAGEFLVIYEDALGFGFSSEGNDVIMLTSPDSTTGLDFYDFERQQADRSEGRFPDGINSWYFFDDPTKGVSNSEPNSLDEDKVLLPEGIVLYQNYPNPFNPVTTIQYTIGVGANSVRARIASPLQVDLSIYNTLGQKISTLVSENKPSGTYTAQWDASGLPTGFYLYKLRVGKNTHIRKMMLIK